MAVAGIEPQRSTSSQNRLRTNKVIDLQVLSNVSARMAEMHEAGYAHRAIKPANIIWLPHENRWSMMDFACAASIGGRAAVIFSPTYASPELLHAVELNAEVVEVFSEADVWAFGVLAFELLTGAPAYCVKTDGLHKVRLREVFKPPFVVCHLESLWQVVCGELK